MAGIPVTRKTGPRSFECATAVVGGRVCEARAAGRIAHAAVGSVKTLGVSIGDGVPPEAFTSEPDTTGANPVLNAAPGKPRVALAYGGDEAPVLYATAAAFGDRLKAAADGAVTPMEEGDDARSWVGTCTQSEGVAADAVGLMRTV